jgi:hypothetical protein
MKHIVRALALILALQPVLAEAQSPPASMPFQSLWGRLGRGPGDTGPGQAIPFATLLPNLVGSQSANQVYAGPTSGGLALPTFRALVGADLPVPGASSLGGVLTSTCSTSNWFSTLSTSGVFGCSQPNFTDLAGSIAAGQIPAGTITNTMVSASAAIALSKLAQIGGGTLLGNNTGSTGNVVATQTPILGIPGSAFGTIAFGNATSGSITITPPAGALGSVNNVLQPANDTFVYRATTDALTNKTFDTAGAGNVFKINGTQVTTPGQIGAVLCVPSRTVLTTGTSQTYTTPTCNGVTATWLEAEVQGGGASGGGSGTSTTAGNAGNASSFGALTASGGSANAATGVVGGAGGTCAGSLGTQQNFPGSNGPSTSSNTSTNGPGGAGALSFYGGAGAPNSAGQAGLAAPANSGGGGSGGSAGATAVITGPGGAAGCHISTIIASPAATYTYTVGAAVAGGAAGTSCFAGGGGAAGLITVVAHWQ